MMFDDQPKWLESIDQMVDEKRAELDEIYNRFQINGKCRCPLTLALENQKKREELNDS